MCSSTSCKPSDEATIPNFQEFMIIKRTAKLARYFCHCFLQPRQISVAKFDTRFNTLLIGYNKGLLPDVIFIKMDISFPSQEPIVLLCLSSGMAKMTESAHSVSRATGHSLHGWPVHQDSVAPVGPA